MIRVTTWLGDYGSSPAFTAILPFVTITKEWLNSVKLIDHKALCTN